jgi:hypothetical protein
MQGFLSSGMLGFHCTKNNHCGILSQKGGGVTWHLRPKLNGLKQPETL